MNYIKVIKVYLVSVVLVFLLLPIVLSNYSDWGAVIGARYIIATIILSNIFVSIYGYIQLKSIWKIILMLFVMNTIVYFLPEFLAYILSPISIFSVSFLKQCAENIIYNAILSLICFIPTSIVKLICVKHEKKNYFKK